MTSTHRNLIRLKAAAQEYEWGRTGSASLAARLGKNAIGHGFQIDEKKSYAEVSDLADTRLLLYQQLIAHAL